MSDAGAVSECSDCILVAVSDPEALYVLERFLSRCGSLMVVRTLAEARDAQARAPSDVALVDVDLEGGDAVGWITELRARQPWMQVLAICDQWWADKAADIIAAGASDIVIKPFDIGALVPRVGRLRRAAAGARAEFTHRLALEERLRHADRLAALGTVLATFAHEAASPLAAIGANARALSDALGADADIAGPLRNDLRETADDIITATEMLRELVSRLRAFARRGDSTMVAASLSGVVDMAIKLLRPRLAAAGVTLVSPSRPGPVVLHAPVKLTQALMNALTNAIDAAGPGGRIEISYVQRDGFVGICVDDDGPGLSDEMRAHLQDLFFTTKANGVGLGMRVMSDALRDHGGCVEFEHAPGGRGLRVLLLVPRQV